MLILLPPSETKRPGGTGAPLDLPSLALPALISERETVADALVTLSDDPEEAMRVLKLSERQRADALANAELRTAPTMPAIDRYTGVLFDALDAESLAPAARRWLGAHALIHSAPFGPIGALDPVPPHRLAAGTRLPGIPPLKRVWADAVTAALAEHAPPFILDLRSEAYAALGPVPASVSSTYVRVLTEGPDGSTRALNHFNKHAKGELARTLAMSRPRVASLKAFLRWAESAGWVVRPGAPGEIDLIV